MEITKKNGWACVILEGFEAKITLVYRAGSGNPESVEYLREGDWSAYFEMVEDYVGDINLPDVVSLFKIDPVVDPEELKEMYRRCSECSGSAPISVEILSISFTDEEKKVENEIKYMIEEAFVGE